MTDRIQNLVDAGRLTREPAPDPEVAGLWANALVAFGDASITGMSAAGRLVRAYDAGRIAATALVRSRDLRVRAANHHEITLGAAALIAQGELRSALRDFEGVRVLRSDAEYGWQAAVTDADAERVLDMVGRILLHGAEDLRAHRPTLADQIKPAR